jgi:hypothetical protein
MNELTYNIDNPLRIEDMQAEAFDNAQVHGWHDKGLPSFGDMIALAHSELSEALEEFRICGYDGPFIYYNKDNPQKPEGIGPELADAAIRLGHMAERMGIDLQGMVKVKQAYNRTRPYRHGGKVL